ncbi:MAG: class I SAM-dependent methyltransferase, partial [Candidatus Thermoplasmatota archaeon]
MVKINDFDSIAEYYDLLEQKNQPLYNLINNFLIKLFKENKARSILDFTCGTGAQAIPLAQQGFDVVGCDIGKNLLRIAKAKSRGLNIKFKCGDVRFSKV